MARPAPRPAAAFTDVPDSILDILLSFLHFPEACRVASTCRGLHTGLTGAPVKLASAHGSASSRRALNGGAAASHGAPLSPRHSVAARPFSHMRAVAALNYNRWRSAREVEGDSGQQRPLPGSTPHAGAAASRADAGAGSDGAAGAGASRVIVVMPRNNSPAVSAAVSARARESGYGLHADIRVREAQRDLLRLRDAEARMAWDAMDQDVAVLLSGEFARRIAAARDRLDGVQADRRRRRTAMRMFRAALYAWVVVVCPLWPLELSDPHASAAESSGDGMCAATSAAVALSIAALVTLLAMCAATAARHDQLDDADAPDGARRRRRGIGEPPTCGQCAQQVLGFCGLGVAVRYIVTGSTDGRRVRSLGEDGNDSDSSDGGERLVRSPRAGDHDAEEAEVRSADAVVVGVPSGDRRAAARGHTTTGFAKRSLVSFAVSLALLAPLALRACLPGLWICGASIANAAQSPHQSEVTGDGSDAGDAEDGGAASVLAAVLLFGLTRGLGAVAAGICTSALWNVSAAAVLRFKQRRRRAKEAVAAPMRLTDHGGGGDEGSSGGDGRGGGSGGGGGASSDTGGGKRTTIALPLDAADWEWGDGVYDRDSADYRVSTLSVTGGPR